MRTKPLIVTIVAASMAYISSLYADHNSPMGAGTANMPNDIHNTRIEDDNATFLDLVQGGGGADSINRYSDDTADTVIRGRAARSSTSLGRMSSRGSSVARGGGRR